MSSERVNTVASVLSPEVVVIGNVSGQGDLEIRGRVQGNLRLEGRLLLAKGGTVIGNVEATSVVIAGTIHGDIEARSGIEIQGSGSVEGNLAAPRIGIETGAQVRGMLATVPANERPRDAKASAERPRPKEAIVPERVAAEVARLQDHEPERVEVDFEEEDPELDDGIAPSSEGEGPLRARRRRKRRRKRPELVAGQHLERWSEDGAQASGEPAPAPVARHEGPPRPPTFQKGTHAQRRRS